MTQQSSGRNFWKIALLTVAAFVVLLIGGCNAPTDGSSGEKHGPQHHHEENAPPEGQSAQKAAEQKPKSRTPSKVESAVKAYYEAAASGDYEYTYDHLYLADREIFTLPQWKTANEQLNSDKATYVVKRVEKSWVGYYDVKLTVNGKVRKTTFAKEVGIYRHQLSPDEYSMFTDALYSASSSAKSRGSASASASNQATVTVVDVVDGDTFDISKRVEKMDRVRMIGVDTPEVYGGVEPCGKQASAYTKQRLEGKEVRLEIGVDPEDPYHRLLAYVFLGDEFFNETLVHEGLAEAKSYPPNTKYDDQLAAAQATAKTPSCSGSEASASASASSTASASPAPSDSGGKPNNGVDDVNCSDLSGPVTIIGDDEDQLDSDGDGTGCEQSGSQNWILLERVMNLGENRIEMRIPQSAWFPRDLYFPRS